MEAVRVIMRIRPLSQRDVDMGSKAVVRANKDRKEISVSDAKSEERNFTYDAVYASDETTEAIFDQNIAEIIDGALQGYNGTIFAYGQTGSGKSYTMHGGGQAGAEGVVFRAIDHIYRANKNLTEGHTSLIYCSFLEIYKEELRDLLTAFAGRRTPESAKAKLRLHEDRDNKTFVEGLTSQVAHSAAECRKCLERGLLYRQHAATKMNADSSRSHTIFSITIELSQRIEGKDRIRMGKLCFVDLAGSERQGKSDGGKERQEEATRINLSLSTLGRVIQALTDGKSKHIPYRDSKLTRLLESSLGGNAKTVMISCVSPADDNREESLNTLVYASRAKSVKNKPIVNTDPQAAQLWKYLEEIGRLKELNARIPSMEMEKEREVERIREELREAHQKEIKRLEEQHEKTLQKYEVQMKQASAEEKSSLIKQQNDELSRIEEELGERSKDELRRLEMQKAEEFHHAEDQLRHALEIEKKRIQTATDAEMMKFRDDIEQMLSEQKYLMEEQQKAEMVKFEDLQKKIQQDHESRMEEEKRRLENDYRERQKQEQKRLEKLAETETTALRARLETERDLAVIEVREAKDSEMRRIEEFKNEEIKEAQESLSKRQEAELNRFEEERRAYVKNNEENFNRQKKKELSQLEERLQLDQEKVISRLQTDHQEKLYEKIESLKNKHAEEQRNLLTQIEELHGKLDDQQAVFADEEKRHKEMMIREQNVMDVRLRSGKEQDRTQKRENEELFRTMKRDYEQKLKNQELEYRLSLQDCERKFKGEVATKEVETDTLIKDMRNNFQSQLTGLQKSNKVFAIKNSDLQIDVSKLEERNEQLQQDNSRLTQSLDELHSQHISCGDLLDDQRQRYQELEEEITKLQRELERSKDNVKSFENDNNYLQEQVDRVLLTEPAYGSVVFEPQFANAGTPKRSRVSNVLPSFSRHFPPSGLDLLSHESPSGIRSRNNQFQAGEGRGLHVKSPQRISNARRKALFQAVAGVSAESLLQNAHHEYEKQVIEFQQQLDQKEDEIAELKKDLHDNVGNSRGQMHELNQDVKKHHQISQLYQQMIRTLVPHLPDCNYKNLQEVIKSAVWNDGAHKWQLPQLVLTKRRPEIELNLPTLSRRSTYLECDENQLYDALDCYRRLSRSSRPPTPFDFDPHPGIQPPIHLGTRQTPTKLASPKQKLSSMSVFR